jgi:DNA topoisomerase-1
LVIVESPAKAKTINKYLGANFEVAASKGHVRDLPKARMNIDIEGGWIPKYQVTPDRKAVVADLKKKAAKADTVYLAPDPDREGEAIAWHLKEALGLSDERVRRVTFNEITKSAIQKAFANPGTIDADRVAAQEARRFLDRVVGYKLSPLLGKKVARGLSAGRVQSVAARLIIDREREIDAFKPEEYWKITAMLAPAGTIKLPLTIVPRPEPVNGEAHAPAPARKGRGKKGSAAKVEANGEAAPAEQEYEIPEGAFLSELAEWAGKKFEAGTEATVKPIVAALKNASYTVSKIEQKDKAERPAPPFETSTLQQQASIRLRMAASITMRVAQKLYEGVELGGEGAVALITYMRTDSTRIAADAITACRDHILNVHGKAYVPEKPNFYASGKDAQEAHEAIRPTDVSYTPERVAAHLTRDELRLYTLIYNRFVACQMTPAIFAVTNVEVTADQGLFKAQGKIMKFDGYRRVFAPAAKREDAILPALAEKMLLDLLDLRDTQHFTQPPPRFNEASLVQALKKEGIGRPSTYASIITTIQKRGYVELKERRFFATEIGKTVTNLLVEHFPTVLDLKFTRHMESELDQIADRKSQRNDVLNEFWAPFKLALEAAEEKMPKLKGVETGQVCPKCGKPLVTRYAKKRGTSFFGCSGYPECKFTLDPNADPETAKVTVQSDVPCPTCGKMMEEKMGPRGKFLGCSSYPDCKTTMNFDAEGKPVLASRPTEHKCEKCGSQMVLREGPRGPFLACTGFPKCRNAKDVDADGNPVKPIDTGIACEKCGAPMGVRRGPRGPFLGCTAYPKCRSTKPVPEDLKEKLKTLMPAAPKKEVPQVEVTETCPDCDGPMQLKPGRRGTYFLGCKKFPKCRGTREASPEIMEQVTAAATK